MNQKRNDCETNHATSYLICQNYWETNKNILSSTSCFLLFYFLLWTKLYFKICFTTKNEEQYIIYRVQSVHYGIHVQLDDLLDLQGRAFFFITFRRFPCHWFAIASEIFKNLLDKAKRVGQNECFKKFRAWSPLTIPT